MLADGEIPHPSTYRGCSHAKKELIRRKVQKLAANNPVGRMFFSEHTTPATSFTAVVHGNTHLPEQPQV
jgi:hypothetical protein